jgi:capsule polysaccharide export protein KpsE/RkpR
MTSHNLQDGRAMPFLRMRVMRHVGFRVVSGGCACAVAAYAYSLAFLPDVFTARTVLIPPQQQQTAAVSALSSLGSLAGLASAGTKSPADQLISLLQSETVSTRIVKQFNLQAVYKAKLSSDARRDLADRVAITLGKKDGLLFIDVDDLDPQRAASIANAYVDELREITNRLSLSEAQQRRVFFEKKIEEVKRGLAKAQQALQSSGVDARTMKADPRTAAESYARIAAQLSAAELELQGMRQALVDSAPEVARQSALISKLREEKVKMERQQSQASIDGDYTSKYREYKYQEVMYEAYFRQLEIARADEAREGALIQVVDVALPPERRSKPRRMIIALTAAMLGGMMIGVWHMFRAGGVRARASL